MYVVICPINYVFDVQGETFQWPERVPFRLTHNMVHALVSQHSISFLFYFHLSFLSLHFWHLIPLFTHPASYICANFCWRFFGVMKSVTFMSRSPSSCTCLSLKMREGHFTEEVLCCDSMMKYLHRACFFPVHTSK